MPRSSGDWLDSTQKRLRMRARRVFSSICAKRWPMNYKAAKIKMLLSGCINSSCICNPWNTFCKDCLESRTSFSPKSRLYGYYWNQGGILFLCMTTPSFLGQPTAHSPSHSTQNSNSKKEICNNLHKTNTKHSLVMCGLDSRMADRPEQEKVQYSVTIQTVHSN